MTTTEVVKATDTIKAGERRELRSLIRMRVKLLRAEIAEAHAAQMAEIDGRVAAKFQDDTDRIAALRAELDALVAEANTRAAHIFAEFSDVLEVQRSEVFGRPWFTRREDNKTKLRRALVAAVEAQTQAARHRVAKLEAELLTSLALDALKTDAAQDGTPYLLCTAQPYSKNTNAPICGDIQLPGWIFPRCSIPTEVPS